MREIRDRSRLESCYEEQRAHFRQRPPVMKLVEFEKGEILNDSLKPLRQFYMIVQGSVSTYSLTEDGSIRYISKTTRGTLLGDMEFSGAGNSSFYIEAAETVLHRNQTVTECSHSNVAILKDGALISHPNDQWILRGITKTQMIQDCWRLGIPVYERTFTLEELMDADEILISSSTAFCRYADSVDGRAAGGKDSETRQRIQRALLEAEGVSFRTDGTVDLAQSGWDTPLE